MAEIVKDEELLITPADILAKAQDHAALLKSVLKTLGDTGVPSGRTRGAYRVEPDPYREEYNYPVTAHAKLLKLSGARLIIQSTSLFDRASRAKKLDEWEAKRALSFSVGAEIKGKHCKLQLHTAESVFAIGELQEGLATLDTLITGMPDNALKAEAAKRVKELRAEFNAWAAKQLEANMRQRKEIESVLRKAGLSPGDK